MASQEVATAGAGLLVPLLQEVGVLVGVEGVEGGRWRGAGGAWDLGEGAREDAGLFRVYKSLYKPQS